MNFYIILTVILCIISILLLVFYSSYSKLKHYKEKMDKAESIIEENLDKKLKLIISINTDIKKVTGKKDYLKDYVALDDLIIMNIEKDLKLDEADKLINDLIMDYEELKNEKNFVKSINELKLIDEVLASAKNIFNKNAVISNQIIKSFPNNIVAKIAKFKIRSFYNNNKTDSDETF